jgi:hypothetical protein
MFAVAFRHELIETSRHWKEPGLVGLCPFPTPTPEELAIHQKEYRMFEVTQDLRNNLSSLLNIALDGWGPARGLGSDEVGMQGDVRGDVASCID